MNPTIWGGGIGPGFLNQVPTLLGIVHVGSRVVVWKYVTGKPFFEQLKKRF